ncbi:MAG: helix-turn-helix transcriptional regulator [Pseudomonadota bacterium]
MQELKDIDNFVQPERSSFQSVQTSLGHFWRSHHSVSHKLTYKTALPPGLHLGAGIADITISSPNLGRHQTSDPVASILTCPPDTNDEIETTLGLGENTSCGLYIPFYDNNIPEKVRSLLSLLNTEGTFYKTLKVRRSVVERLCTPMSGWAPEAYQLAGEARAYELLAVLTNSATKQPSASRFYNEQQMQVICDILERDLKNPPTLSVLAEKIGVCTRTLTKNFKDVHGISIGGYITNMRLQKGLSLIEDGVPVSQAAYSVGYSLPHFSKKFREKFGYPPSTLKQI